MAENYWTRYMRRRPLSRRTFLKGTALAGGGAATAVLIGCGDDDDDDPSTPAAATARATEAAAEATEAAAEATEAAAEATEAATEAAAEATAAPVRTDITRGGILTLASPVTGDQVYDPAITNHATTYAIAMGRTFNRILNYDGTGRVNPELAESLPEQPDDLTYVFKLNPNIHWHDLPPANGRQFTAEDAAFGINRFNEPNAEFIQGQLDQVERIDVIDDLTFSITTKEPFAPMLRFLADDPVLMVNREQREAVGDEGMKLYENQLGTGPFIRNTFDPGVYAKVDRNPNYFEMGEDGQQLPYLDGIELVALSREAYEGAFITGEVDLVSFTTGLSLTEAESLQGQMGDRIDVYRKLHSAISETHMHTQKPPFNDVRVRQAVHLVINRQIAANPLGPGSGVLMGPVPQNFVPQAFTEEELLQMPGWREQKDQDIADAIALMNAAGVGVGADETITINTPIQCPCHATGIKADVEQLGLNLELEPATSADYFAERAQGNFIMNIGLEVGGIDPDTYIYHRFHTGAPFNRTAFSDPEVDSLLEKQRATLDPEARADAIRDASLAIIEHSPQAFTAQLVFWPVSRSYVHGHAEPVPAGLTFNFARLWKEA
ncbi:MAG: ABC transporter substrate-binding protein [Dehalococcoidia bacterium]|nr:ABC transporter substrate-binding protein [Dehalococcoidia bacterium]